MGVRSSHLRQVCIDDDVVEEQLLVGPALLKDHALSFERMRRYALDIPQVNPLSIDSQGHQGVWVGLHPEEVSQ